MAEQVRHRLGSAVQFVDAFTATPVRVPLDVRVESLPVIIGMPGLPWRAVRGPADDTYRFLVTNDTIAPVGSLDVSVDVPGREYASFEPFALTLPRPLTAHPPTPARSDFLVQHALWPTRALRLPPGETAIVAVVRSAGATPVARLKVTVWPDGQPQPVSPYGYTSDAGELVYRLPDLKTVVGGVIALVAPLRIDLTLPPAYTTAVVPTQISDDLGTVLGMPFTVRLGQVARLAIDLP
jgi:hypothetical protein